MIAAALLALSLSGCTDVELVRGRQDTAIVACGQVVHRARLAEGREITDVAAAGGRLAWGELRRARGRWTGRVSVGRIRDGRIGVGRRRIVVHAKRRPRLRVVLTSHGDVAWLAGERIVAWRRGGSLRAVARHDVTELALDDDRTLRWRTYDDFVPRFRDLRRWPRGQCPQRSRFRTIAANEEIVVTLGRYGREYPSDIVRACMRGRNRDGVIAVGYDDLGNGVSVSVLAVYARFVVLAQSDYDRYYGCSSTTIGAVDARDRYHGRTGGFFGCEAKDMPQSPLVVTEGGAVAWIARDAVGSALITGGGTSLITLDAAGPDGITDLTVDGRSVRWLHDGEPRSADLG